MKYNFKLFSAWFTNFWKMYISFLLKKILFYFFFYLLYPSSCSLGFINEHKRLRVVLPLTRSILKDGFDFNSPISGLSRFSCNSGSASVSTLWFTLKLILILNRKQYILMVSKLNSIIGCTITTLTSHYQSFWLVLLRLHSSLLWSLQFR